MGVPLGRTSAALLDVVAFLLKAFAEVCVPSGCELRLLSQSQKYWVLSDFVISATLRGV